MSSWNPFDLADAKDEATLRYQFEFLLKHRGEFTPDDSPFYGFGESMMHILCRQKGRNVTKEEFRKAFYGRKETPAEKMTRSEIRRVLDEECASDPGSRRVFKRRVRNNVIPFPRQQQQPGGAA
jgi:hypothetical protein